MKRSLLPCLALPLFCIATNILAAEPSNPLAGAWILDRYVDIPDGGAPVHVFGERPVGLFLFTADGHVAVSLMRDPAAPDAPADPDPDACVPVWYCSYFGTYDYDPAGPSWTTHVTGGNIPSFIGTSQKRSFTLTGDRLVIAETYHMADGTSVRAERILHRAIR